MSEVTISKFRQSVSQIALAFSGVGLFLGIFVMSPDGRFAGFGIMAACAVVALLIGPRRYRIYGATVAIVGIAGAALLYGDFQRSPYMVRAQVDKAYLFGSDYCIALGGYRQRTGAWPNSISGLDMPKTPKTIKSVTITPGGTIKVILSFPPLMDKSLMFVSQEQGDLIQWQCSSSDIEEVFLPSECRRR